MAPGGLHFFLFRELMHSELDDSSNGIGDVRYVLFQHILQVREICTAIELGRKLVLLACTKNVYNSIITKGFSRKVHPKPEARSPKFVDLATFSTLHPGTWALDPGHKKPLLNPKPNQVQVQLGHLLSEKKNFTFHAVIDLSPMERHGSLTERCETDTCMYMYNA